MKNEYFQNDVIGLRILGDIASVCIYRFPLDSSKIHIQMKRIKSLEV